MSFGSLSDDDEIMSEINMTPLVDVMLVLLIIFMITVPAIQHAVKLDLPHAANHTHDAKPPHINLSIYADGKLQWDNHAVELAELPEKFASAAIQHPQPELHLFADRKTPYERVAQVMSTAQAGGLLKIGFITNPKRND